MKEYLIIKEENGKTSYLTSIDLVNLVDDDVDNKNALSWSDDEKEGLIFTDENIAYDYCNVINNNSDIKSTVIAK